MKMVFRAKFESSQTTKFQEFPIAPILIPGIRLHGNWAFESYRAQKIYIQAFLEKLPEDFTTIT